MSYLIFLAHVIFNTCLHLVHRPRHIDLEEGGGHTFLLNNFEAANTNPHSDHLASLNPGKVGRFSNLNLAVIHPVLT